MGETVSLYVVRHAIAAERGEGYPDDALRPLTARGIQRFRTAAAGLVSLNPRIELILTSRFTRARQTADILSQALPKHPGVEEIRPLEPDGSYEALLKALSQYGNRHGLALVGHEPGIGMIAARLIGAKAPLRFKKGAVCRIEVETLSPAHPGVLLWFAQPRLLRALA
jgi:phosphohistidine phosphatase